MKITHNIDEKLKHIDGFLDKMDKEISKRLRTEAELVITEAKLQTPVDFGFLRASGRTHLVTKGKNTTGVAMVFGGAAAPYAVYVHENTKARHTVGNAKFLERPWKKARSHVKKALEAVRNQLLKKHFGK